jgi:hypothetical protein
MYLKQSKELKITQLLALKEFKALVNLQTKH